MLVSAFTKLVDKHNMYWERCNTSADRYIKVSGQHRCSSKKIKLDDVQRMGWIEAWLLLRSIQKQDVFEMDYAALVDETKRVERHN
jgi:hypothetical protein